MAKIFDRVKDVFRPSGIELELSDDYIELDKEGVPQKDAGKILIKLFTLREFDDIKQVVDSIREGHTISVVNILPLREKDTIGLKRAIDKLKKTVEANEGDVAGLAENLLIATPSFARVHRGKKEDLPKPEVIEYD